MLPKNDSPPPTPNTNRPRLEFASENYRIHPYTSRTHAQDAPLLLTQEAVLFNIRVPMYKTHMGTSKKYWNEISGQKGAWTNTVRASSESEPSLSRILDHLLNVLWDRTNRGGTSQRETLQASKCKIGHWRLSPNWMRGFPQNYSDKRPPPPRPKKYSVLKQLCQREALCLSGANFRLSSLLAFCVWLLDSILTSQCQVLL